MSVQDLDVQLRAVKIDCVVDDGRRFSIGKGASRVRYRPAPDRFLSIAREQQPMIFHAANETADIAGKFSIATFAPAAAMTALQR